MIKLVFLNNREVMNFEVVDRNIFYYDRYWIKKIRCIPKDEEFIKKIICSRNKFPTQLLSMFNITEKAQKEYDEAKDDEALADIIVFDCQKKGLTLLKREVVKNANNV